MKILGVEWNQIKGTEGHSGTSEYSGTLEETTTSAVDGQPEIVSGVTESRITVCENPAL